MGRDLFEQLRVSGVHVRPTKGETGFTIHSEGDCGRCVILRRRRAPYPAEVKTLEPARKDLEAKGLPLLLAPYISPGLGGALTSAGWSWADDAGNLDIRGPGMLLLRRVVSTPPKPASRDLPTGAGKLIDHSVADPPCRPVDHGHRAGSTCRGDPTAGLAGAR